MAGALTANSVNTRVAGTSSQDELNVIGDVALLSPVDGANNVLLIGIIEAIVGADDSEQTFRWYRCFPSDDPEEDILGDPVGPAFVVTLAGDELVEGSVVIMAVDKGPGMTSAYALTGIATVTSTSFATAVYVDAVLFD